VVGEGTKEREQERERERDFGGATNELGDALNL
jgi:hypothetical protein